MVSKKDFIALSDFRYQLARFQRFSVSECRRAGLTQTQYMLLLHVAGFRERDWTTVGELAHRLQASPHGTAALVKRCVALRLVTKHRNEEDARRVEVRLTERGRRTLEKVARAHKDELKKMRQVIRVASVS